MWPHKANLGVQLGYGVWGNGEVVSGKTPSGSESFEPELHRPRLADAIKLHRLHKSQYEVQPPQKEVEDLPEPSATPSSGLFDSPSTYVPPGILHTFSLESRSIVSSIAYDPTEGNVVARLDVRVRSGGNSAPAIFYVSGESGNILSMGRLGNRKTMVKSSQGSLQKFVVPVFPHDPFKVVFSGTIKQVETCHLQDNFDAITRFMLVRTDQTVYVLSYILAFNRFGIGLITYGEIQKESLEGYTFADATFSSQNQRQFALVDVKGNVGMWEITQKRRVAKLTFTASIYDLAQLSNWKKVLWTDPGRLLVLSRTVAKLFDIDTGACKTIIASDTWSRILDFKVITNSRQYCLLLTSKEVLWLRLSDPVQRIITWKHFLDDSDPSLKLSVCEYDNDEKFICMVYSVAHPLKFVFTFGFHQDRPCSLRDPYYIELEKNRIRQIEIYKLNRTFFGTIKSELELEEDVFNDTAAVFACFEVGSDLQCTMDIFSSDGDVTLPKALQRRPHEEEIEIQSQSNRKMFMHNNRQSLLRLWEALQTKKLSDSQPLAESTVASVQSYALQLGEWAETPKGVMVSYQSLVDIGEKLPQNISDVEEFDTMIEQLCEYYNTKGLDLASFVEQITHKKLFSEYPPLLGAQDLCAFLRDVYRYGSVEEFNEPVDFIAATITLAASLLKVGDKDLVKTYELQLDDERKSLAPNLQQLVDSWADEQVFSSQDNTVVPSSAPTINIASQDVRSAKRKLGLHNPRVPSQLRSMAFEEIEQKPIPSQLASQLASQVTLPSSQIPRLQLSQRKKKRKGGFG